MDIQDFAKEFMRLKRKFGEKSFDGETKQLIWESWRGLPAKRFSVLVTRFLSERAYNKPPLPKDFADAALEWRRLNQKPNPTPNTNFLKMDVRDAPEGLQKALFALGCRNVAQAIEVWKAKYKGLDQESALEAYWGEHGSGREGIYSKDFISRYYGFG